MGKTNTIIELNGKRYDALTGALLPGTKPAHHPAIHHAKTSVHHSGKTVDGIVRRTAQPQPAAPAKAQTAPTAAQAIPKAAAPIMDIKRSTHHTPHRKTDRSHTLMRTAVKKPAPSLRRTVKTHAPRNDVLAKVPEHHVAAKLSVRHVDARRLKRAERIAKNKLVSRFGHVEVPKTVHHTAKTHAGTHNPLPAIQGLSFASDQINNVEPVFAATAQAAGSAAHASMDIFEQALMRASSHKESYVSPKHAKKKAAKKPRRSFAKRLASTGAGALAVVALLGFFAYQNTANLTMRIASSKAGFAATLPAHRPSGFSAGAFAYHPGYVAVNFKSNSDNRAFSITQKVSNWNSQTLLNEYVASNVGKDYHKLESGGRTIYTYGDNNATWVDKGIWYDVQTGGNLSTSQLLDIATSM